MNLLAIDYGQKNIGLAWVDTDMGVVLPYGKFETRNWKSEIVTLIENEKIHKVLIGLPLGMDGEENVNTKRVRAFGDALESLAGVPIEYADERFTSQQADAMGGSVSRDEKSAMVILQSYLERRK